MDVVKFFLGQQHYAGFAERLKLKVGAVPKLEGCVK